ncbi:hypothetical protein ZIOFF_031889 [Zingiber officinale]|uniref:Deoxyuridine 5'-triphosphate nucleotidohydrolase n=1 Tax=Zingiber officinale TaxID=94328 RepID=A0A8J5GMZ5_ZINOF|nr:hypothetical protein ZIOFF_031889 [Zingiber officinale]
MVGRLSNTPNVGFSYEVQGVVDYLTSHGVNALPGRRFSTRNLQGVFINYDGTAEEYYELYGDMDDYIEKGKQIIEQDDEDKYSSKPEPHILINKISPHAVTPTRHTKGSAGFDISASHAAVIEPYGRDLIHTGLRIEIPHGYYARLASRPGLAWKTGVEVGAGVIDSDYRGKVQVFLFNRTNLPIYISQQQKIVQLILEKIVVPEVYEVPHLSHTERGNKGFGSTENALTQSQASTSQQPQYFATQDIFSLLMPKETAAILVQEDLVQNDFEKDHEVDTSPGPLYHGPWTLLEIMRTLMTPIWTIFSICHN